MIVETKKVGPYTVNLFVDEHADHPECEGLVLVGFHRSFWVSAKGWENHGCMSDFEHPQHSDEEHISGSTEPTAKPVDGPADPLWRAAYLTGTTNQLEVLLAEAGEDIGWSDREGRDAAYTDYCRRADVFDRWQTFRDAHAEWGCYELHIRDYGGGHVCISLGDVYEGGSTDRWGYPSTPDGYVLVQKKEKDGSNYWGKPVDEVAQGWVREWQSYLEGDVWAYEILDEDGDSIDSCHGFIGDRDYAWSEAVSTAEAIVRHDKQKAAQAKESA